MKYISINDGIDIIKEQFPIIKDISEVASDSSRIYAGIKKVIELRQINKIKSFIENIELESNVEIIEFIDDMNEDEKVFFTQAVNKVIDLDDALQIFIISTLVQSYRIDELNYFEKSLYYNIGQISQDDFSIYYCFYARYILDKQVNKKFRSFHVEYTLANREIVEIVLKKFISYGIIIDNSSTSAGENSHIKFWFTLTSYSQILYENLHSFFKNQDTDSLCEKYLPIQERKRNQAKAQRVVNF